MQDVCLGEVGLFSPKNTCTPFFRHFLVKIEALGLKKDLSQAPTIFTRKSATQGSLKECIKQSMLMAL